MENISLLLESSESSGGNGSLLREFPYWQPLLAVSLLLNTLILSGTILVLYLPLLIEFIRITRNEQLKALNFVHVSLLIASILDNTLRICLYSLYLPSAFRYCVCSGVISAILIAEIAFLLSTDHLHLPAFQCCSF